MKKLCLFAALACIATAASSQSLFERYKAVLTTPRSYDCFRAVDQIRVDGILDEASWTRAQSSEPFVDIRGEGYPTPTKETTVKMVWDYDHLYIAATLTEDNIVAHLTQRDTIIYHDNDFEVFLDPDGDAVQYFEIENNARGVVFDLMLDKSYRSNGSFFIPWNCEGLQLAIGLNGTLNKEDDTDKSWVVEMAIPFKALTFNFTNPRNYSTWRINFSRVQHLVKGQPEENWVWSPTGKVDMHMADRWGFLNFVDAPVGSRIKGGHDLDMNAYKLLWAMFYAQLDNYSAKGSYISDVDGFKLTGTELAGISKKDKITVETTSSQFIIRIALDGKKKTYSVDQDGRFTITDMTKK
ncbi:MAG TPA: carbohydrate-binding family 9-like protein [Candidatus Phocaeicola excrementigallinarum]|nr:carbohydrate-binding family 9-like protein [Candidatus Phocaeicola excrementigallinarum]